MAKRQSSIKIMVVVPMLILGIVSVISNIMAIRNIKNVNANASNIVDHYMAGTDKLSEIQKSVQNIHKMALTHILAMDFDTMIHVVEGIKEGEEELDGKLAEFQTFSGQPMNELMDTYAQFKQTILYLVAMSANRKTTEAYAVANGDLEKYGSSILNILQQMMDKLTDQSAQARVRLGEVYQTSLAENIGTIIVSLLALTVAFLMFLCG